MTPRRILLVQTAYLGDLVLTTPLIDAIRDRWPSASVHLVTTDGTAGLLVDDPRVDSIDSFAKPQTPAGVASFARLVRRVRALRPDTAIVAQRSWRSGLLARLSAAGRRVGFRHAPGAWAYTHRTPWHADVHQSARYASLAVALDGDPTPAADRARESLPSLSVTPSSKLAVRRRLHDVGLSADEQWLCMAPGSARATKRWPATHFARLARRAADAGVRSCLIGAPGEERLADEIRHQSGAARPASLVGRVPLRELPAVIAQAASLVGNDSAPAHIAAAVGTPVVTLFGPTDPSHGYAPRGATARVVSAGAVDCRPCSPRGPRRCPRGDLVCLTTLEVADVFEAVLAQIRPPAAHRLSTVS